MLGRESKSICSFALAAIQVFMGSQESQDLKNDRQHIWSRDLVVVCDLRKRLDVAVYLF